jgi:DNA topoisomerase-3
MCNVAKYVSDAKAKKILQDTDGIGTPATRAAIIEKLFERGFVERRKKQIRSTPVGRALIAALPVVATTPDQTAIWESAMRRINDGQLDLGRFLGAVTAQLTELVTQGKAQGALPLPAGAMAKPARTPARKAARKAPRSRPRASRTAAAGRVGPG